MKLRLPALIAFLGFADAGWSQTAPAQPQKHLIQLGWDQPTTAFVRDHWEEMEKGSPFDGLVVVLHADHAGRVINENAILDATPWPRSVLAAARRDLRACAFTRFRHNFIRVNSTPGKLDWFDDQQWQAAAAHLGHVAWLCRESGFKGICYDTEVYGAKQYGWNPATGRSFPETQAQARQRGREVMRAMAAEYPAITVWGLWLFSLNRDAGGGDWEKVLREDGYGLWPAFLNGWLDALPPEARLVDGMEDAYYFKKEKQFAATHAELRDGPAVRRLVAPENQAKYRAQVRVSFGIYLDAYLDRLGTKYALPARRGGTRLQRLASTLATARATADDYVWLYNEQVRWWQVPYRPEYTEEVRASVGKGRLAEEALPGITKSIRGKGK